MFKHTIALVVGLSVLTFSANAALYDRGNGLIYDDTLNITWLQNATYAKTQYEETGGSLGSVDGSMTWTEARFWVANLNYRGYTNWRLPSANLINGASPCDANNSSCDNGYNIKRSELGHMYFNNLANLSIYDVDDDHQPGYGVINRDFTDGDSGNSVSISNLGNTKYWFNELADSNPWGPLELPSAWTFDIHLGSHAVYERHKTYHSWAVHPGDIAIIKTQVPVPAAMWLLSTALLGLAGVKRRYR